MFRTVLLSLGAALLAFLLWHLGPSEIFSLLRRIGWYSIPIALLYSAHEATRGLALWLCVLTPGVLRYRDALGILLSGEAVQSLSFTGPILGQPTRAWLLERRGLTLQESFAATLTEYLISSFVTAGISMAALIYLVEHFDPGTLVARTAIGITCALGTFLVASAVAISRRFYLIGTIIAALASAGVLRGRLKPNMTWINRMEDMLLVVLRDRPARFVAVAVIEAAALAWLVLELFWLLWALNLTTPRSYPFVIEGSTGIIGTVFLFIPLQVGVAEGVYALVFSVIGLPAAAGFAVAFLRRLRSLVVASIGLATLALLTRDRHVG